MVITMVTWFSLLICLRRFMSSSVFSSSRFDVDSSTRIMSGLLVRALMTTVLCLSPPLRLSRYLSDRCFQSKYVRSCRALSFLSFSFPLGLVGLPAVGGSDEHDPRTVGDAYTVVAAESLRGVDVIEAIRA